MRPLYPNPTVLELRLARSFIAVAEEGHFARAAQRLHITQPALSRQIQQLERELGVRLLTRVGRAARLTVAGRVFLDHARRLLAMAEESAIAAKRASEGIVGRLVVGFVSPATYSVLPATFRAFRERAPDVALELRQLSSGAQAEALRAREIDLGLLHPPVEGAPLFGLRVIVDQPFVAALPARHPLANERSIRPEVLAGEAFIIFPRVTGPGLYDRFLHHARTEAGGLADTEDPIVEPGPGPPREDHERLARQRGGPDAHLPGERMTRRQRGDERLVDDHPRAEGLRSLDRRMQ